jgi:predicted amidophosphoribosyltransferase
MDSEGPRIRREKKTITAMVRIYCKNHHESKGELCPECNELLQYAKRGLDKCPFQEKKTTCRKCLIHCYQPQMRERVRKVMKYAGPRMLLHHPVLAMHHAVDGLKKPKNKHER